MPLAIAALRGHEAELAELTRTTISDAHARGEGLALTITEFLSGTLNLGLGRFDAALTALGQVERYHEEGAAIWALIELIDSLTTNHTSFLREKSHFEFLARAASEGLRDAVFIRNSQGCQTQGEAHGGEMRDTDRSFPKAYSVALPA